MLRTHRFFALAVKLNVALINAGIIGWVNATNIGVVVDLPADSAMALVELIEQTEEVELTEEQSNDADQTGMADQQADKMLVG